MGTSQTDLDLPLVRALQAGDESALNKLIRKYQEPLFRFIWRYTGDEETARDLLQETFVRLRRCEKNAGRRFHMIFS
jgi:RNA polymerase sigma-70 factor (ECF subfamily)